MSGESGLLRQQCEEMERQYGGARQQQPWPRWVGGQNYQQPLRQQQQQHAGTSWVGNTGRGWYQPESPPPPEGSMRGVDNRERYGALGHKTAICRAPNAFPGACRACGEYGHMSRQRRIAGSHAHVIAAVPAIHWPPSAFAEYGAMEAERAAWREQREKKQARLEAPKFVADFAVIKQGLHFRCDYCENGCSRPSEEPAELGNLTEAMTTGWFGQGGGSREQQEREALPETPRTPPPRASSVQQRQHQQSESEVVELSSAAVDGAHHQHAFSGGGDPWGWNHRGFRKNYAYTAQMQQREYGGGAGGDKVGVAAGGLRPAWGTDVPFSPREKR